MFCPYPQPKAICIDIQLYIQSKRRVSSDASLEFPAPAAFEWDETPYSKHGDFDDESSVRWRTAWLQ